ncbi:uncharacterized protein LOC131065462 [Cryptomeria japonica]|uniref:uncharacterized protein LOC131065462 n=1 Tax=Cryptomeria japonica TaxID=3369 RepID=UPI0025AD3F6C|nr:uncharacterized protein LOC131065462 [Cryptomeria japonica]
MCRTMGKNKRGTNEQREETKERQRERMKRLREGHVYAVIADENNEEGTNYFLCRCIEAKKKLTSIVVDGEGIEYPIESVVVSGTWLRRYHVVVSSCIETS